MHRPVDPPRHLINLCLALIVDASFCSSDGFNYDKIFQGATTKQISNLEENHEIGNKGYLINRSRISLGSGSETLQKAKDAIRNWRHFDLGWAFVNPNTPITEGVRFCVCVRELLPWIAMPLQVISAEDRSASFRFSSGTLGGHLLAGEEMFAVEMDDKGEVWYEIVSFSKPAHILTHVGRPYVRWRQKVFAHQSSNAVLKQVNSH